MSEQNPGEIKGTRHLSPSRTPKEFRGSHPPPGVINPDTPPIFGDPDRIQPMRKRRQALGPNDAIPEELGLNISPDEITEFSPSSPSPIEIKRLERAGEIPKVRTVPSNRLMLSTPDISHEGLRTVKTKIPMKIKLTSKWMRDSETGLIYVQAAFDQYLRDGQEANDDQKIRDKASFMEHNHEFFNPEGSRPNNEGLFYMALIPKSGWISSIF